MIWIPGCGISSTQTIADESGTLAALCICVPAAKVLHVEHLGGTLAGWKQRFRSMWRFHYGAYTFFRRHSGWAGWHPVTVLIVVGVAIRFVLALSLQAVKELTGVEQEVYG